MERFPPRPFFVPIMTSAERRCAKRFKRLSMMTFWMFVMVRVFCQASKGHIEFEHV